MALALATACSTETSSEDLETNVDKTEDAFIASWDPRGCILAKTRKPELKICIRGNGNVANARAMTTRALESWLVPLRARYTGIATSIAFDCNAPDGTVNAYAGSGGGLAGPSVILNIYDTSELGSWIHEFGHAFACLGDTYVGGRAGACMAGQPRSIMCHGLLLNDITADDVAGMVQQANRLGFDQPPPDPADDTDGDGVPLADDRCPTTPAGATVWHEEYEGRWWGCARGEVPVR